MRQPLNLNLSILNKLNNENKKYQKDPLENKWGDAFWYSGLWFRTRDGLVHESSEVHIGGICGEAAMVGYYFMGRLKISELLGSVAPKAA